MLKLSAPTKRKLRKLADFLETTVKNKWFHIDFWATGGFREKKCGSTACALGWATTCFPRSGLSLEWESWGTFTVKYDGLENIDVAEKFFGIDNDTAYYLFMPESYPEDERGRNDVINRLREVVKQGAPNSIEEYTALGA